MCVQNLKATILLIFVSLFATTLYVVSLIYYQNFLFEPNRNGHMHMKKVIEIQLNIAQERKYRSIDLLFIRSRIELNSAKNASKSDVNDAVRSSDTQECIPLDYSQCDRIIWSGSDSDRRHLYSELALLAEHYCYRDSPEYLWRFAVALYYRAALLPSSVALSHTGNEHTDRTRTFQIALISRANESISRARELTHNTDPRVLKWCGVRRFL